MKFWLAILLIAISTALTQWHGIQFWIEQTHDKLFGWVWSPALEIGAFWLWLHRHNGYRALAVAVSVVLLAGPLHYIAAPHFLEAEQQQQAEQVRQQNIEALRDTITNVNQDKQALLNMAESGRRGWADNIMIAQQTQQKVLDKLIHETTKPAPDTGFVTAALIAAMQAIALLLLWLVSVIAINSQLATSTKTDQQKHSKPEPEPWTPERIDALNEALVKAIKSSGLSGPDWAAKHGFVGRDLAMIRTHNTRVQQNNLTAPVDVINRLAETLKR